MTPDLIHLATGAALIGLSLWRLATTGDAIWRILALNVLSVGTAILMLASARIGGVTDPVPQAFVLTGIVVLVAVTAALLALAERMEDRHDD